ncbi:MAG TPA: DUF1552 domain-containing protein [Polyangiaceae bacterium]|jgi:hypothetical protein|nr:DUF1552 domain-containing protein [Polyangiaceae bacterium]
MNKKRVTPVRLSRRVLLRGAGGVVLGLPLLECMLGGRNVRSARAQTASPQRYGIVFAGQAIGGDDWATNSQRINGEVYEEDGHFIVPATFGADYAITTPLEPLSDLKADFSVLSNLSMPYSKTSTDPGDVPAGGAYRDFHGGASSPLLCGVRSQSADFRCGGTTSDQALAAQIRGQTLIDSLVLRAQPSWYLADSSYSGRQYISYDENAEPIEAQVSPLIAYQSLFGNFDPGTQADSEAQALHDFRHRSRLSILDLIGDKRDRVLTGLGKADRERLERHYDELRDLEQRIDGAMDLGGGQCALPPAPGDDPAIGGDNAGSGSDTIATNTGYSEEGARTRLLLDLVHMAWVCDLSRVATVQITVFQSHMNALPISTEMGLPIRADLHEVGHNGDVDNKGQLAVSTCLKWHAGHYAYFLDKLKNTPEGEGTLLDNSAVVFMPEGGHGTQLNDAESQNQTHSVEQMVLLVAGRAGGLAPGRHIDASGYHPVQGLLAAMQAAGYSGDSLGEVTGAIAELFG